MKYYLGCDVGGTKTQAMIADGQGNIIGIGLSGPGNHESVGFPGTMQALGQATQQALDQAEIALSQISAAGYGLAGLDWPSEEPSHMEAVRGTGITAPVKLVNDAVLGLYAGTRAGWGVAVDAGTGDNCWGRNADGDFAHMTGGGAWFAEHGGAGSLVLKAVQSIALEWGRRGPATRLTEAFVRLAGAKDIENLLEGLSQGRLALDAGSAPEVFRLAEDGDEVARDCVTWAAQELGSMAAGVIRKLALGGEEFDVVMMGSMFNGGALYTQPFQCVVKQEGPKARFSLLDVPPAAGAVILAMEIGHVERSSAAAKKVLENSKRKFGQQGTG